MKRKLIKRNKQFLSSRYDTYKGGRYSFQILYYYTFDKNDVAQERTIFDWTFSTAYLDKVFTDDFIADWEG
jgi:hypothetical protein